MGQSERSVTILESFMKQIAAPGYGRDGEKTVKFRSLQETDEELKRIGFRLEGKKPYGPGGGWMLSYRGSYLREGLVVRLKTHGESSGRPRAYRPHLSVYQWKLTEPGTDTVRDGELNPDWDVFDWQSEQAKISTTGVSVPKSPSSRWSADTVQGWADHTHLMFPGFEDSSAENPRGLRGGDSLSLHGSETIH